MYEHTTSYHKNEHIFCNEAVANKVMVNGLRGVVTLKTSSIHIDAFISIQVEETVNVLYL